MTSRDLLEAILAAAPEDDAASHVYGDWMLAHGDPRGELIAIDAAALDSSDEARRLLRKRRDALLVRHPGLAPPPLAGTTVRWGVGFVREVVYEPSTDGLAAWFAHPALAFVSSISCEPPSHAHDEDVTQLHGLRIPLRALALGDFGRWGGGFDLDPTLAVFDRLQRLRASSVRFTRLPHVRVLDTIAIPHMIEVIARADAPVLERLVLRLATRTTANLTALFAPLVASPPPRLALVELVGGNRRDEARRALAPLGVRVTETDRSGS